MHDSAVNFLPFAANASNYPPARFSMLPKQPLATSNQTDTHCSAFLGPNNFLTYSRYALVEALQRAGVKSGSVVLLPAYHCRTIVDSALYLQAEVQFYPLDQDLRPIFEVLAQQIDSRCKAILITHYFGFPNHISPLRQLCDERGIALIEDCAHAFYGQLNDTLLGTIGDYAIASAWKFFPIENGAILRDNRDNTPMQLNHAGWFSEFKAYLQHYQARLQKQEPTSLPALDYHHLATSAKEIAQSTAPLPASRTEFSPNLVNMAGFKIAQKYTQTTCHAAIIKRRRDNYVCWLNGIQNIPSVQALFPKLDSHITPYAFPLLTDIQGVIFHALKLAGIPIWRWEDMARTPCHTSNHYRLRLLQLPCHQDLSHQQIEWMLDVLRNVATHLQEQ